MSTDQVNDRAAPSAASTVAVLLAVTLFTTAVVVAVCAMTGWAGVGAGWLIAGLALALPAVTVGWFCGRHRPRLSSVICVLYIAGIALPVGGWLHDGSSPSPRQLGERIEHVQLPPEFRLKEERRRWAYFSFEVFSSSQPFGWQAASVSRVYYTHLEPREAIDELTASFRRDGWLVDVPYDATGEVPAFSKRYLGRPPTAAHWADALKDGTQVSIRAQVRSAGALRTFDPPYRYYVVIGVTPTDMPEGMPTPSEFR